MKFEVETLEETTIFTLKTDRLDSNAAPDLKSQFVLISNSEDNENLIVDISSVTMADSSGISALLLAYRIYRDSERTFILCGVQPPIRKLLEITQLDKVFTMMSDRDAALDALDEADDEA
jgi:anti-anti-sigma factor